MFKCDIWHRLTCSACTEGRRAYQKFFGWIDYQKIFLAIGFCSSALRARVELQNAVKNQQRLSWRKLGESTKPHETITQKLSDANAIAESSQPHRVTTGGRKDM